MPLRPTRPLIAILILWTLLGLAESMDPQAKPWWELMGFVLGVVTLFDALIVFVLRSPKVERILPGRLAVGVEGEVALRIVNTTRRHLHVAIYDGVPERCECEAFPWRGWIRGKGYLDLNYPITLPERGAILFGKTSVLLTSLLGLWSRHCLVGEEGSVKVYPNYQPVLSYALLAMAHRQEHTGIIRKNRAGLSRDFHQLRDYQMGDSLSQIDWKASSKRQSLISRDFQEQLDQSVILMLDCGRRMRTIDGEISQFDHCLNSMLLLSYVALRQGDQVGILSFGGTDRWLPPVKGASAMTTVLNHLYDYETSPFPSDFSEAAERLLRHQRRRSMVVVMTNLRGEDAEELREPLRKLRQKHVVVLASLCESGIGEMLNGDLETFDDALGYLAAQDYAAEREGVLTALRADGIVTLDETAQHFPIALANAYLDTRQII
ncbi:MAG: hypothetical protein ACJAVK_000884 [Akkermansiaceae bacterium]|jgi:uncharacterized protein (DUF58 family)